MRAILAAVKDALQDKIINAALDALLSQVVEQHKQEMASLGRIEGKVDALLSGPFKSGSDWLISASRPHRSNTERIRYIELAQERFVDSQAQLSGHAKVISQLHVALTHGLLGHPDDFNEWLLRARTTADSAILSSLQEAVVRQGFFTGMFGRSRRAARAFVAELRSYEPVLQDLNTLLGRHRPIEWSAEIYEWEEWVPPIEMGESGWTTRRALIVYREGEVLARLSAP